MGNNDQQSPMSEEAVLSEVQGNLRLERLGIDPHGDPVDMILKLWALKKEWDIRLGRKVNP